MDIIVDIDGTLADCTHRLRFIKDGKKDWDGFFAACDRDKPVEVVCRMVNSLLHNDANRVILCSGRPERTRAVTERWLYDQMMLRAPLYMRADGDYRADDIIKRELLARIRADGFNPVLAIDDRKRVVDMWRSEGLICAQVAEGEF